MNDVVSIGIKQYYCGIRCCGYDYIFCKICEIKGHSGRSIMQFYDGNGIMSHMATQHDGSYFIDMDEYDFVFPSYFGYLKVDNLYDCVEGDETLEELKIFMKSCEYSCIICRNYYDCLPSKEVVVSHVRDCLIAVGKKDISMNR